MERSREGRRDAGGGAPVMRHRPPDSSSDGGAVDREHELERDCGSKRRRRDRASLLGVVEEDDGGDCTSSPSIEGEVGDDGENDEQGTASGRLPGPPTPRTTSSVSPSHSCGGGHQYNAANNSNSDGIEPLSRNKACSLPPVGGVVPRKARSAAAKRTSHEWLMVSGGLNTAGNGGVNGDLPVIHRHPPSASTSPCSSAVVPDDRKILDKDLKQQRPFAAPVRVAKSPTPATSDEAVPYDLLEAAEVLSGLTRQFALPAVKPESSDRRIDPNAIGNPASMNVIAPKRKRPRVVKYDEDVSTLTATRAEHESGSSATVEKSDGAAQPTNPSSPVACANQPAEPAETAASAKTELATDGIPEENYNIDIMAPLSGKLSPDGDGALDGDNVDADAERKALDLEFQSVTDGVDKLHADETGNATRLATAIDLEDRQQPWLDLEKPSRDSVGLAQSKDGLARSAPTRTSTVGFPPFSHFSKVPPASSHQTSLSSDVLQPASLFPPRPVKPKRCVTHSYVAKMIQYEQRLAQMNPCRTPAAPMASANAASFLPARKSKPPGHLEQGHKVPPVAPVTATASLLGSLSKEKATASNSFPKQTVDQEQPRAAAVSGANMPVVYFPVNPEQAVAATGNAMKSTIGAGNAMPMMNLNLTGLPPRDAQYLAILQSGGYPIPVPAHTGPPVAYGTANGVHAFPFFHAPFYGHPAILETSNLGQHRAILETSNLAGSTLLHKHEMHHPRGPFLLPGHTDIHENRGSKGPVVDSRAPQLHKSMHEHNLNFTLMPTTAGVAPLCAESKPSFQKPQHQLQSWGLELSSSPPNRAIFQSHQEATRPGFPPLGFTTGPVMEAAVPASNQQQMSAGEKKIFRQLAVASGALENQGRKRSASVKLHAAEHQPCGNSVGSRTAGFVPDSANGSGSVCKFAAIANNQWKHGQLKQVQQQLGTSRPKSAAPSGSTGGHLDRLPSALMSLPQILGPNDGQSPFWKGTSNSKGVTAGPSAKNSYVLLKQGKPSPIGVAEVSRSSNATGSPSNSISRSTGGSPSAISMAPPVQQSSGKSAATNSSPKMAVNHYNLPSIIGTPNALPVQMFSAKHQQQQSSPMKQQTQGSHFFFSTYAPHLQHHGNGAGTGGPALPAVHHSQKQDSVRPQKMPSYKNAVASSAGILSLGPISVASSSDPGKAISGSPARKALHPCPGVIQAPQFSAAERPTAGGHSRAMPPST